MNNEALYQEIKKLVRSTYFDQLLSKQSECKLDFSTRKGHIARRYNYENEVMVGGIARKNVDGMDPSQLDYFFELLQSGLARHPQLDISDVSIHTITKRGKIVYFTITIREHVKVEM
jgi:hypothetical protein